MTSKKEINEEKLNKTSGGFYGANGNSLNMEFMERALGQYETEYYIGKEVVVFDKSDYMFMACGTLIDSYEKSNGCGTRRHIKLALNPNYKCDDDDFCIDEYSKYECHAIIRYY